MKLNVVEVFCEILSGLVLIILIIPILELTGKSDINSTWKIITENLTTPNVVLLIIFSYLLGLIVDSIGFSIGEWFLDNLINDSEITDETRRNFFNNVSSQTLSYRETQWAYYSLYRNLFILFIIHGIVWSICIIIHHEIYKIFILLAILSLLEISLFRTMKSLFKLYNEITSSIDEKNEP